MNNLIQVDKEIITTSTSSVTLTGTTTDHVYMAVLTGVTPVTDGEYLRVRFTVGGSNDGDSNYDRATLEFKADAAYGDSYQSNANGFNMADNGTATGETHQSIFYIYNANTSSEYTFASWSECGLEEGGNLRARNGGGVLTEEQATDGLYFFYSSGNIASGKFALYRVSS